MRASQSGTFAVVCFCIFSLSVLCPNSFGQSDGSAIDDGRAPAGSADSGYVLVTPLHSKETVLVTPGGNEHHVWTSAYEAASGAHLLADGSILRVASGDLAPQYQGTGLRGGRVQRLGWSGEVLWDFWNAGTSSMVCGEALMLPNGNVLMTTAERRSQEDALKAGRDRDRASARGLCLPGLLEVNPRGKDKASIVWKWSAWDHVMQDRNPHLPNYDPKREQYRRLDLNAFSNSVGLGATRLAYDEGSDTVLITLPGIGEVWLLDHGTTTKEAALEAGGKRQLGGGILWRWSEATVMPNLPRVLSADFVPQQNRLPDSLPNIATLALHGPKSEKLMQMSVQQVSLKAMDLVSPQGRASRDILHQWDVPFDTNYDVPNNLSLGTDSSALLLSSTGIGKMNGSDLKNLATAAWHLHSQRGLSERKVRIGYVDTPCCGKAAETAIVPDTRPTKTVTTRWIGTPRHYSSSYVNAIVHSMKPAASQVSAQ